MSAVEIIGLVQTTVLLGIFFRLGGLTERVRLLEKWRDNARLSHQSAS